jgi:hypothetical protein
MTDLIARLEAAEAKTPISNARLIAELQAVTVGIHLVGLDRLPQVMNANRPQDAILCAKGSDQ